MVNAVWPASLPQHFLAEGFSETLKDDTIRAQPETGGALTRPRTTLSWSSWAGAVEMTPAQSATFRNFYTVTLVRGSLPFDWLVPGTATAVTMIFTAAPSRGPRARGLFDVWQLALDEVPT